jgi:hypothetical protein
MASYLGRGKGVDRPQHSGCGTHRTTMIVRPDTLQSQVGCGCLGARRVESLRQTTAVGRHASRPTTHVVTVTSVRRPLELPAIRCAATQAVRQWQLTLPVVGKPCRGAVRDSIPPMRRPTGRSDRAGRPRRRGPRCSGCPTPRRSRGSKSGCHHAGSKAVRTHTASNSRLAIMQGADRSRSRTTRSQVDIDRAIPQPRNARHGAVSAKWSRQRGRAGSAAGIISARWPQPLAAPKACGARRHGRPPSLWLACGAMRRSRCASERARPAGRA